MGGSGLLTAGRQSSRVASLAPKHAAGRARRALRCQAMMAPSSFMGARVQRVAGAARSSRTKGRLVVTNMFERFTEKVRAVANSRGGVGPCCCCTLGRLGRQRGCMRRQGAGQDAPDALGPGARLLQAIKVVMLAQEEARRLGHNFVGTEQILLGLIGESTGIAAKVLKSMGVNLKDARVEVEKIIGRGSGFVAVEIPFTPRAKRVLELSLEEARQLGEARRPGTHGGGGRRRGQQQPGLPATRRPVTLAAASARRRPQLHRHGAHPAGPAARGRGRGGARAGDAGRRPLQDPHAGA